MTQPSEERVSDQSVPSQPTAVVIPFERPQSELQKAVQQRAHEMMERERDRANQRPPAWRRALVLMLAVVPVVLTFGAAFGFVGALRQWNSAVFEGLKNQTPPQQPASAQSTEPGVVMLQSYDEPRQGTAERTPTPVSPAPR